MYKIGQVVQGVISGIKPYGAFVKMDDNTTGMVHISEISDLYVNDVSRYFRKGEKVVVKVIDIDEKGQLRLSLKAIQSNRKYAAPLRTEIASTSIGFKSLQEKLPEWIDNALEEINND